ncbi:TPA: polysaccharide export protein [Vibrio parahaemolyticus]|nr:polysaccharide export protein [Vibrio parahaemolyticus]
MNFKHKKLASLVLSSVLLSGCTVPGSHLSTDGKNFVEDSNVSRTSDFNVFPLTLDKVSQLKSLGIEAKSNPELDRQLSAYEYEVGPGDILNITIWDHPELTIPAGSYRSSAEAGKNVRQIRADISRRLAKYIESPQVDVSVAAFRSKKSYITGEVNNPGQQPITNIPLTLLDAINRAGGLAENADWKNVTLTRNGIVENISLYALMQEGDLTENRLLQPGDIIHVPRNDSQKVFVMGEVNDPKLLKIDRAGMSLTEALSNVGGINQISADATGVFVIRRSQDAGSLGDIYQLDVSDAAALVIGTEFALKPYDIVYVTAAPISRWNRVIAQLVPTISGFNELTEGVLRVRTWP